MKRSILFSVLVTLGCLLPPMLVFAIDQEAENLYNRHCAACHGIKGDGEGSAAYLLSPKPRNFTLGVYKFRSTPTGEPPTDQDLLRTLKQGIPGTPMPAWDRLPERDLVAIVEYLKSFSDIFEDEDSMEPPIVINAPPPLTVESVKAGHQVYQELECFKCHGPGGKGDGPTAPSLKDDEDRPIRPYDFTRGPSLMKGGASAQAIYRTFMTGLDGTPMPSFIDDLEEEQRWQLVHYIQSLSSTRQAQALPKGTPTLHAIKVSTDPSLDLSDPIWTKAPVAMVPLRPLWARNNWVDSIKVQIVVGPKTAAFRFEWPDVRKDEETIRPQDFRDAVAIQYVPDAVSADYVGIPFIGMGDKENAVTIWHWKADWEADVTGGFGDVVRKYGKVMDQMVVDLTNEKEYLSGRGADNPLSIHKRKSSVEVLKAKGFGTLTSLPPTAQTVKGRGVWRNGVWTVVMHQVLDSAVGPPLRKGQSLPFAVAAWDGTAGDRNGQKSVSQWMELVIE